MVRKTDWLEKKINMFGLGLGVDFRISPIQSKLSHSPLSNDGFSSLPYTHRWPCGPFLPNKVYGKCGREFYRKGCFLIRRIDVRENKDGTWNVTHVWAVASISRQACGHSVNLLKRVEQEDGSCSVLMASLSTWTNASTSRILITI